jgi:hypothetical protein
MIEIEMPGDIQEFEAKVVGSLTARQTICFGLGGVLGFLTYRLTSGTGLETTLTIIIATLPILCGIYNLYDMPLEKFAIMLFLTYFLPPKNRKYITENMYEECFLIEDIKEKENIERTNILNSRKKKKKNRRSKNEDIIDYK